MKIGKLQNKKEAKKAESKKTISKSKEKNYLITCDEKGNIKKVVPQKKK